MNLLISGITTFIKFDHYLEHKMAGVLMKTGIILYALIAIANVALIAVSVVRLADYIKNKKQYDEHNEFVEVYNVMDISPKSRDIRDKMNVLCIWIAVLVLVLLSLSSIMYVVLIGGLHPDLLAGVPSTVIGYAVPIALCFIMIVSNWIKRGKWLPVVLSYLVFWYIVYDIIFYMFSEQILVIYYPLLVVLQNIDFTEVEARIIIWIVACICIGVVTIVNGIYGILDKREK